MRLKKTSVITWVVLSIFAILISAVVIKFSLKPDQKIAEAAVETTTENLFQEMGIIQIPHIAPPLDFKLSDLNGNMIRLSDFKGKIVFLNFWTTWCPECRYEMPLMQNLYTHFKDKDFAMVAINMNEPAFVVKKYFKDNKLTFTALLDTINELGAPFGIRGIPTTYIIDRDGGIIGKAVGSRRWDSRKSIALFERLINSIEKKINTNEHEQKKNLSSNSIKPDTGTGNSIADPIYTA
jgi:peroxiredoxin